MFILRQNSLVPVVLQFVQAREFLLHSPGAYGVLCYYDYFIVCDENKSTRRKKSKILQTSSVWIFSSVQARKKRTGAYLNVF